MLIMQMHANYVVYLPVAKVSLSAIGRHTHAYCWQHRLATAMHGQVDCGCAMCFFPRKSLTVPL